jgi:AcrR family transcriptional regulator
MALAAAVWARCTGVNPASVYRRWRTREGLLADVAMSRLERDLPLPDTGSLRGDLTTWAVSAAAGLARPEGRLFLLALITSIPSTPQAQAERDQHLQRRMRALRQVTDRAATRGESPPTRARSPTRSWARSTGARYGAPSPPIPPTQAHSSTACSARPATTTPTSKPFRTPHTGRTHQETEKQAEGDAPPIQPVSHPQGSARPPPRRSPLSDP